MLYGSHKPGRSSYYICRTYIVREIIDELMMENDLEDLHDIGLDLQRTDETILPPPKEILRRTLLRVTETDTRIAPNLIPISIPAPKRRLDCKPNHDPYFGSFAF